MDLQDVSDKALKQIKKNLLKMSYQWNKLKLI